MGFPYAQLVLDLEGKVVCANERARRLIAEAGLADAELTCCKLVGCGEAGTVLAHGCVTELALARGGALPEVRVEVATTEGPAAMWVAAGVIDGEPTRIGLQLRPGSAGDRRRRSDPHWTAGPTLRIGVLGPLLVESAESPMGGAWLEQRTGQLLRYLVAERRRGVTVDEIGESIWPGAEYAVGSSVRYYVHALRGRLEPERPRRAPSSFIEVRAGAYRLRDETMTVDADEFEAGARAALALLVVEDARAEGELERAVALYGGEFLADAPYADWAQAERGRLHELACLGLDALAGLRERAGEPHAAAAWLERLAALQPYDEDVHRRLMRLDIDRGRRSDAVRRYSALRSRMRRTFGHDPDFTPADLGRPPARL